MKLKIKNSAWILKFVDKIDDYESLGLTKTIEKQILILKNQPTREIKDTIAHELVHAYHYECGLYLDKDEAEKIATFIGRIFVEMKENFEKVLKEILK